MRRLRKKTYSWGTLEWLAGSDMGNAVSLSVAKMTMIPGSTSESHRHPNCEEAILVAHGRIEVTIGEARSVLYADDCIVVAPDTPHHLRNIGVSEARITLMYGAGVREYEPT